MHHLSDEKSDELMSWVLKRRVVIADLAVTDSVKNNTVFPTIFAGFHGKVRLSSLQMVDELQKREQLHGGGQRYLRALP